jgi:hypothetical protein
MPLAGLVAPWQMLFLIAAVPGVILAAGIAGVLLAQAGRSPFVRSLERP